MQYLTEDDIKFKSIEHYNSLKAYFNRNDVSKPYEDKYKWASSIGYVSGLMKRLKPTSLEDAYRQYLESGRNEKHLNPVSRGRDENELEAIAKKWRDENGLYERPLVDYYDALVLHAVVETYEGYKYEQPVMDALMGAGFDAEWPDKGDDGKYAVDIIVKKHGCRIHVQVKPLSFFTGMKDHTKNDRVGIWDKMKAARKKFGDVIYRFVVYDKQTGLWVINENEGRCSFNYGDLVDDRGKFLKNGREMEKHETDKLFNSNI